MKRMSHRSSDIVRLGVATGAAATGLAIAGTAVGAALIAKALLRGSRRYNVRDKSVLITGGSRGLGLVLAREFAKRGARVAVCARSAAELERAKSNLWSLGYQLITAVCDVTDREQVQKTVESVANQLGPVDNTTQIVVERR